MDGIISWEEFVAGSETMPMLFTAFHELLPVCPRPWVLHLPPWPCLMAVPMPAC